MENGVGANRKATVTQITTLYNSGELKSISLCTTHQTMRQMLYKSKKNPIRLHFHQPRTEAEAAVVTGQLKTKNIAFYEEFQVLLRHTAGTVRISMLSSTFIPVFPVNRFESDLNNNNNNSIEF